MKPLEQLLDEAQHGNSRAIDQIIRMHEPLCRYIASGYFLAGAADDDVLQEARVGLLKAIRDYNAGVGAPFNSFAQLVIERQIITAVKTYARMKHTPLTGSVRVGVSDTGETIDIVDLLPSTYGTDPYYIVVALEDIRALVARFKKLSPLERLAIVGISAGIPYTSLGNKKSIDNAAQRARRKLAA